jgi:Family of unknown function (DUF6288)
VLGTSTSTGYVGSMQDFGEAIERAESGAVPLPLMIVRPGQGGQTITATLPAAGAFGAAYPLGSTKFDAIYEHACAQMHIQVQGSTSGFSYDDGWYGLIFLSHPNWNDTTGTKPFRLSINKLVTWSKNRLTAAVHEPVEAHQAGYVDSGLENWALAMDSMFLSEYRRKSGDTTVDATIQRAAELLCNRIEYWKQPDTGNGFTPNKPGIMGHGGVVGDYLHLGYGGGMNIMNAHVYPAIAMLKAAGANVSGASGMAAGDFPASHTYDARVQMTWNWLKQCTATTGTDAGNVGYISTQGGGDSCGRTAGSLLGFLLYGNAATADDTAKVTLMRQYLPKAWQRWQLCHAYTVGGVGLYSLVMPFLADRDQRFILENARHFYHFHRKHDGTLAYFGGRENNGGDDYLNLNRVRYMNTAIIKATMSGNLPSFPQQNANRLYVRMAAPWVKWPTQTAHTGKVNAASTTLVTEVADAAGAPVTTGLAVQWTQVSGPGTVTFGSPTALTTTAGFSADGTYRVQLTASRNGYTLTEPYEPTRGPRHHGGTAGGLGGPGWFRELHAHRHGRWSAALSVAAQWAATLGSAGHAYTDVGQCRRWVGRARRLCGHRTRWHRYLRFG